MDKDNLIGAAGRVRIVGLNKEYGALVEEIITLASRVRIIMNDMEKRGLTLEEETNVDEPAEAAKEARSIMDAMRGKIYYCQGLEDGIKLLIKESCRGDEEEALCKVCMSMAETEKTLIIAIEDLPIGR
jgi:hypothetical protein